MTMITSEGGNLCVHHIHTHTYIYIYIHICIHIYIYICTYIHMRTHKGAVCADIPICRYVSVYVFAYVYIYICTYIYHIHRELCKHVHIHSHMYMLLCLTCLIPSHLWLRLFCVALPAAVKAGTLTDLVPGTSYDRTVSTGALL